MIGKTNIPMGMARGETATILLKTNQSSHSDLTDVTVSVSVDGRATNYIYGGQFTVEIPKDSVYTVTFPEVDGYKTPDSVTYTAVKGFSRGIEAVYYTEAVTVNVSAHDGASVDGQSVVVSKAATIDDGVYILDTDGKYWNTDDWDGSATPSCIAIKVGFVSFGLALEQKTYCYLGDDSIKMPDVEGLTSSIAAQTDYDGKGNTELLRKYWDATDITNAFGYVCSYVFPDGRKGYLGSMGEYHVIYNRYADVEKALTVLNKTLYLTQMLWSSTAYNVTSTPTKWWYYRIDGGKLSYASASSGATGSTYGIAIALCSLDEIEEHPIVDGKASFKVPYDDTYTVSVDDMDGYQTPESKTYTASQATRTISMEYTASGEHLIVNVSSDDNAVSGYEINIFKPEYIGENNEYLKLDYIESTGEQYIHLYEDGDTDYIFDIQFTSSKGGYTGTYMSGSHMAVGTNNQLELYFGEKYTAYNYPLTDRMTVKFDCNNQIAYIDDAEVITSAGYERSGLNIGLFALARNGVVQNSSDYAYMKLYSFVIKYNGGLTRDFIPVMRISDGIVGLYDRINEEFFSSETDVNFKAGFGERAIGTQTSATGEYDIPLGTEYMITASDVNGYTTPASQTFTAESGTRTVDIVYEAVKLGVFIQGVSGKLYEADSWTSQETPNGVAVLTEECSFVIALTEASETMSIHNSNSGALDNYMTAISNETQAKADYDGATNTANIMKLQSGTTYAAGWCNAFSFPSGKKGFLPSLGQMFAANSNEGAVNAALTEAGGTAFTSAEYWTSTFWGYTVTYRRCWVCDWYGDSVAGRNLSNAKRVRAFSAL